MSYLPLLPFFGYGLSAICFVISGLLAWRGKEGWGWFLAVGFLLVPAAAVRLPA